MRLSVQRKPSSYEAAYHLLAAPLFEYFCLTGKSTLNWFWLYVLTAGTAYSFLGWQLFDNTKYRNIENQKRRKKENKKKEKNVTKKSNVLP